MKKYIARVLIGVIALWVMFSFVDYHFAQTMYGGMELSPCNLLVVLYKTINPLMSL